MSDHAELRRLTEAVTSLSDEERDALVAELVSVDEAMTERMARALFARTKEGRDGWTWPTNGEWDRRRSMEDARRVLTYVLAIPVRVAPEEGEQHL